MDLSNYHRDIHAEAREVFAEVMVQKHLLIDSENYRADTFRLANENCKISLQASEDYFFIWARFSGDPTDPDRLFDLEAYLVAILGINHSAKIPRTGYDEAAFGELLGYYKLVLGKFMDRPLQGDFAWVPDYETWLGSCQKVEEFLKTIPWSDNRDEQVLTKRARNDDSWVAEGKSLYFEIHGKEME